MWAARRCIRAKVAEMKTGEGKTLVATLPSYLNALTGKGVHVVTVNDYLAEYQSSSSAASTRRRAWRPAHPVLDDALSSAGWSTQDITYGTNNGSVSTTCATTWREPGLLVQRGQ